MVMEPVGREEIMLSLKSTSVNEVDRISRRRIKFWWKVRYSQWCKLLIIRLKSTMIP